MKRSATSLPLIAAASSSTAAATTTTTTMSSRPYFRGGRTQGRRNYSDQPESYDQQQPQQQIVTGDSHFHSVRAANRGYRPSGNFSNYPPQRRPYTPRPPPPLHSPSYNPTPHYGQPPVWQTFEQSEPNYRSQQPQGPFDQNPQFGPAQQYRAWPPQQFRPQQQYRPRPPQQFRPHQQYGPRAPRPLDYRNWEYAKPGPPPECERFTILSYNILADYLATTHRAKLYIHIPEPFLDWQWRKRRIIFELGLWSSDILCFQEVDRFQELEEELKLHGYNGIWKMRTGDPIDGCAIFWRTSRFKLVHEESIEFNKLGLRDNVAQICVFESVGCNNNNSQSAPSISSTHPNKVVVCNIHVLFNPRRGEIKLGQIRVLFDRAYAVSKLWDEAPVVICGDFNSTPKSPLYNFIAEQKLDLWELPRDKVSGQSSAELPPWRPSDKSRVQSAVKSTQDSSVANGRETKEIDSPSNGQAVDHSSINSTMNETSVASVSGRNVNQNDHDETESCKVGTTSSGSHAREQNPYTSDIQRDCPDSALNNISRELTSIEYCQEDIHFGVTDSGSEDWKFVSSRATVAGSNQCLDSGPDTIVESVCMDNVVSTAPETNAVVPSTNKESVGTPTLDRSPSELSCDNLSPKSVKISSQESSGDLLSASDANGYDSASPLLGYNSSNETTSTDLLLDHKMEKLSIGEVLGGSKDNDDVAEDCDTFLSKLSSTDGTFPSDFAEVQRTEVEELDVSPEEETPVGDTEDNGVETFTYDPSAWTPLEIETATGTADRTVMEHHLKLKSVYSEVKDSSGTRDSSGEPVVTSYHRRFFGTVDYIWRSEGLQTVKVLAPITKHAMQWTRGFPTKKWGSDHIALVSELAFTKDISAQNTEAQ